MNKKAFTLVEVMVSISIFSIVIVFLYESLNLSKKYNDIFSRHVDNYVESFHLQKVLYKDILEAKGSIFPSPDKNKNSVLYITNTNNTYHSALSKYVTYLLSKNGKLLRIESKKKLDIKKVNSDFLDDKNTYIDLMAEDIKRFLVLQNKQDTSGYTIYIKDENDEEIILSSKKFIP